MSDSTKKRPRWLLYSLLALLGLGAYFANVEIQSYLGEKARAATGLELLSLEEASELALRLDKQVLVELSAVWCPACRQFDKAVLSDPGIQSQINANYVFAHLEYESDAGQAFMERYEVGGFPTAYILAPDGTLIRQLRTTMNPAEFKKQLSL